MNMNMKITKMANFSFRKNTHTASFSLDTYQGTYNHCKEVLKDDFKQKSAFQVAFRCIFY